MLDKYSNFAQLAASEKEGIDFEIVALERNGALVAVIAPHAGGIERKTCLIARDIAGTELSLYCFRGLKKNGNRDLHIKSQNFDEPGCLKLISRHNWVVAIHGCDKADERVFLGGLDNSLIDDLACELSQAGIVAETSGHKFQATLPNNVCNRGKSNAGVQFELSLPFRNGTRVPAFVEAVRSVLSTHQHEE